MMVYARLEIMERTRATIEEGVHCKDFSCVERL